MSSQFIKNALESQWIKPYFMQKKRQQFFTLPSNQHCRFVFQKDDEKLAKIADKAYISKEFKIQLRESKWIPTHGINYIKFYWHI